MSAPTTPTFKLVLVGDGGTGKASKITLILLFTLDMQYLALLAFYEGSTPFDLLAWA